MDLFMAKAQTREMGLKDLYTVLIRKNYLWGNF